MKTLEEFAAGGSSSGNIRWEPYLSKEIVQYVESKSILRQFCSIYRLNGTYTANIPKNYSTGLAVEITEGAEIPAVRQILGTVDVKVKAMGTAIQMSDESKVLDWFGNLVARELEEAAKRMLRKENQDILDVLLAGAGDGTDGQGDDVLIFEDILDAAVTMKNANYSYPDIAIMNPVQAADLVKDERFLVYSGSNSTLPYKEGTIGGRIAGVNVVELPEVPAKTVIMMDTSTQPLWLVVLQDLKFEQFRIPDIRSDKIQLTAYQAPAVLRPESIYTITVKASG